MLPAQLRTTAIVGFMWGRVAGKFATTRTRTPRRDFEYFSPRTPQRFNADTYFASFSSLSVYSLFYSLSSSRLVDGAHRGNG